MDCGGRREAAGSGQGSRRHDMTIDHGADVAGTQAMLGGRSGHRRITMRRMYVRGNAPIAVPHQFSSSEAAGASR